MSINLSELVSFDAAVERVSADRNAEFYSFQFNPKRRYFSVWLITATEGEEDADTISVLFEGGGLFHAGGEEDFYDLDQVPTDAKALRYLNSAAVAEITLGLNPDFLAWQLFPEALLDPETVTTAAGEAAFAAKLSPLIGATFETRTSH